MRRILQDSSDKIKYQAKFIEIYKYYRDAGNLPEFMQYLPEIKTKEGKTLATLLGTLGSEVDIKNSSDIYYELDQIMRNAGI